MFQSQRFLLVTTVPGQTLPAPGLYNVTLPANTRNQFQPPVHVELAPAVNTQLQIQRSIAILQGLIEGNAMSPQVRESVEEAWSRLLSLQS